MVPICRRMESGIPDKQNIDNIDRLCVTQIRPSHLFGTIHGNCTTSRLRRYTVPLSTAAAATSPPAAAAG